MTNLGMIGMKNDELLRVEWNQDSSPLDLTFMGIQLGSFIHQAIHSLQRCDHSQGVRLRRDRYHRRDSQERDLRL